jgi:hypothetical protein
MVEEAPTADGRWRRWGRWGLLLAAALLLHLPLLRSTLRPLTPGERALAAIARQALLGGDQGLDYGGFFLHAEGAAGANTERRWRSLASALREQVGPLGARHAQEGIGKMMLLLFREAHLGKYRLEEARMSGYFQEEAGGNCEAQTKLLVSALRASTMAPPDGKELAVEVFQDHVQAVLVDRRRGVLWNLMTGEEDAKPRSDVYHPAVLLAAYLRGLGLKPPIPERKLLLLRGPRPTALRKGWAFFTTSTMKLPAAVNRFAEGPPQQRAELPLPVPRRPSDPPPSGNDKEATWREEFLRDQDPLQLFAMDAVDSPFFLINATLVFRHPEQAQHYLGLTTQIERRRWLLQLARERLEKELTPGPPALPAVEQLAGLPEAELAERLTRIEKIEKIVALTEVAVDRNRGNTLVAGELELHLPGLRQVGEGVRAFTADLARRPGVFVRGLSAMDRSRRRLLLSFLVPRFPSAQVKELAQALGDPSRVALVGGDQGAPLPAQAPLSFTDVELIDVPVTPTLPSPPSSAPTGPGSPAPPRPAPPPEAAPLAAGAYLDLVLSGLFFSREADDALPILARWEASFSEHLVQTTPPDRCTDTLIKLQMNAMKPLSDGKRTVPAHMEAAARRLERLCKG